MDGKKRYKIALASIGELLTQRVGVVWRLQMGAKGASRAKQNLDLDMYFHVRSGFEACRDEYLKG